MQVTAWQHLFTTVEKDRSPTGQRGYQTLFYSRDGLSEADILILEGKAQYYSVPGDPVKRQFYWLSEDRWVVSQTVALAGLDAFGRKGRYLSHSLILPASAWEGFGWAPFGVWSAKPFMSDLDQAFAQGDMQNRNIPPVTLRAEADWQEGALAVARSWSPKNLLGLARMTWQADGLQSEGQHIAVCGEPRDIGRVLIVAYLLAPPDERHLLTFDTHALGCNWGSQDRFWAQGFPGRERTRTSLVVDAATCQIQADALPPAKARPYTRWMEQAVIPDRLDSLFAWQDWALALDRVIQGRAADRNLLSTMDPQFIRRFAELNAEDIRKRMEGLLPPSLPPRLTRPALGQLGRNPHEQLGKLVRGLTESDVVDLVYAGLLAEASPLSSADLKALAPLAESHAGIRRLTSLWSGDLASWRNELDRLNEQEYAATVTRLLQGGAVPSWKMISPAHIDHWFYHGIPYTRSDELADVAQALGECGGAAAVDRLADYVPQLQPAEQKQLHRWLKKSYKDQAPRLWGALELALGKSGSSKSGLKGLLFGSKEE